MSTSFHAEEQLGDLTYTMSCVVSDQQELVLDLLGLDSSGVVHADGRLHLPVKGGVVVGDLIMRVLRAHARMQPRTRPAPVNASEPWTPADEQTLRGAWTSTTGVKAVQLVRNLAEKLGRSKTAVRSRLSKLGLDPDVVGRVLAAESMDVLPDTPSDEGA
ncbi:hypothetical protein [Lentzea terrae]|uniref:hypothetical protein n=1 Tax=Lentzea terrae TaxID=2200761 RepID=UPI000DD4CD81|nr:hypothetical protein [Lentzea terrae]